jgi:hypothetical protein
MSEFLTNLAARGRGSMETIRPRVPSRFEPLRDSTGLLAGRTAPADADREIGPEMAGEEIAGNGGVEAFAAESALEQPAASSRPPMKPLPVPMLSPAESALAQSGPAELANSLTALTARQANSPMAPQAQPAPEEKEISESNAAGVSTPAVSALRTNRRANSDANGPRASRRGDASELESSKPEPPERWNSRFAEPEIAPKAAANPATSGPGSAPGQSGLSGQSDQATGSFAPFNPKARAVKSLDAAAFFSPAASAPALPGQLNARPDPAADPACNDQTQTTQSQRNRAMPMPPDPARRETVLPDNREGESGPRAEGAHGIKPYWNAQSRRPELSAGNGLDRNESSPEKSSPETKTIAPGSKHPVSPARTASPNAAPQLVSSAAEPAIRVTIGRVEVRAVFPEQPARRTAPQRARPTVSLDDYLNRGSGAKR